MHERLPFRDSRLAREKAGKMPCNAGILRVRQAHLRQARTPAGARQFGDIDLRHEAIDENSSHVVPCQFQFDGAAHQCRTAAWNRDRSLLHFGISEEKLFRLTASIRQRSELPRIQILALCEMVRKREVHIVAAKQDVIANSHACELQFTILFCYGNQREVGCASADIHYKDDVSDFDTFSESVAHLLDPGVECRLWFFEQRHIVKPRLGGGLCREFTRCRIERSGNRKDDLFRSEIAVARSLPGPGEVPEISS